MIKEFPAEVVLVKVYCDKCGCIIENYKNITNVAELLFSTDREPKYEYTCKNCGNVQIEKNYPTYAVRGIVPNKIDIEEE